MEEYLYGVIPMEVSFEWPLEALKAQAVVSRTYAARNLGKYEEKGYDLSATFLSQVYGGSNCENQKTTKAVDQTKGEVIVYNGRPITAVFHSTCGGLRRTSPMCGTTITSRRNTWKAPAALTARILPSTNGRQSFQRRHKAEPPEKRL